MFGECLRSKVRWKSLGAERRFFSAISSFPPPPPVAPTAARRLLHEEGRDERKVSPEVETSSKWQLLDGVDFGSYANLRNNMDYEYHYSKVMEDVNAQSPAEEVQKAKPNLVEKIKSAIVHGYQGIKLFGLEVRISTRLLARTIKSGDRLTRRERNQLIRTLADVLKIFPYFFFIVVPMLEFLLPLYIKLFPFMQPSTFSSAEDKNAKIKKSFNRKLEIARVLQDTMHAMKSSITDDKASKFAHMTKLEIRKLEMTELKEYLRQFGDELTFDKLGRSTIIQLCRLLSLPSVGPISFLRFQLRMKSKALKNDDNTLLSEGIEEMTYYELVDACKDRGLPAYKIPKEQLLSQLKDWVNLSIIENLPTSVLLLSSALNTDYKGLPLHFRLSEILNKIPDELSDEISYASSKEKKDIAIKVIKAEEESILKENEEDSSSTTTQDTKLHTKSSEALIDEEKTIEESKEIHETNQINNQEIEGIEDALQKLTEKTSNATIASSELSELKDQSETLSKIKSKSKSRSEAKLHSKIQTFIKELDSLSDKIANKDDETFNKKVETYLKETVSLIGEGKEEKIVEHEVTKEEILKTLDYLKLIGADEEKTKKIVDSLDADKDGYISLDKTLQLIEEIGDEFRTNISIKNFNVVLGMLVDKNNAKAKKVIKRKIKSN